MEELRAIGAEDWREFREVRLRALADAPDSFGVTLAEAADRPEPEWRSRAAGPGPVLVGYADGRPVAMGGAFVPEGSPTAFIWGMWTAPEARGAGWGGRVLDALVAWSRERGLGVLLHVTEGNEGARRLYLARGFRPTGEWEPLREGSTLRIEELRLETTT